MRSQIINIFTHAVVVLLKAVQRNDQSSWKNVEIKETYVLRRLNRSARPPLVSDRQGPSIVREPSLNLRPHHKPSLISWQDALILQLFAVYYWYLKSP